MRMNARFGRLASLFWAGLTGLAGFLAAAPHAAAADADAPAVVSYVKVVSDKIEDVSSLEAWKKSFIKPGMTDEQKALAIWTSVCKFRHQDNPPNEFLASGGDVRDTIKTFNVYGYSMCDGASVGIEELSRYCGLVARGKGINHHSVPEVQWDGAWHLLDASLMTYWFNDKGQIASVDEIVASVQEWYKAHPDLKGQDAKLTAMMRGGGWKNGPTVLATGKFYEENGWLPAATHGWSSQMFEYDGNPNFVYEYGYNEGYRVNVQLREGEVLTRNWSNKGLHVNMDIGSVPGSLDGKIGEGDKTYCVKLGDLAPGRVGNGTVVYDAPLGSAGFKNSALGFDNLVSDIKSPALHLKDAAKPGILEIRMACSYVYLGGNLHMTGVIGKGGAVKISLSRNNGADWKELIAKNAEGKLDETIDLKALLYRLYDYRLRVEIIGANTGLDTLKVTEDIQHSQRPLPALDKGPNTITFSSEAQEGTITVEACLAESTKGNQLDINEFHPVMEGLKQSDAIWMGDSGKGSLTFPITTPGDMTRIRLGSHYRARGDKDAWAYEVSFDDGKTWTTIDTVTGPTAATCKYDVFEAVPKGTRKALVRFSGHQQNTLGLFDLSIHADYLEPRGGFRPVQVTYVYTENGAEKKDVHIAKKPNETYTITCAAKPVMKSLVVELAK